MLRVSIPVGDARIEVEAGTESELEMIFRVAMRTLALSPNELVAPTSATQRSLNLSDFEKPITGSVQSTQLPHHPKLHYPRNASNIDRLEIALESLGREATAGEILEHLRATGGIFETRSKAPKSIVRVALRNDDRFYGTGTGWMLRKWREQNVSDQKQVSEVETSAEQRDENLTPPETETY